MVFNKDNSTKLVVPNISIIELIPIKHNIDMKKLFKRYKINIFLYCSKVSVELLGTLLRKNRIKYYTVPSIEKTL